jgi:hypothetical protein
MLLALEINLALWGMILCGAAEDQRRDQNSIKCTPTTLCPDPASWI